MKVITDAGLRPRVNGLSLAIAELVRGSRAAVTGGAILASALAVAPANAQEAEDDQVLEEVVVTGSRIVRQDFTANSPIQTVDETLFEETSAIGVETVLNRLPQFVPAVTQFTTGDVQQTATNTVGASTVSLRGLGPNRNLVLINGRRAMPVDPRMVVDTNSIPSAAIQRVEVISGGASAVYGADAVGGVVNFILKDDYEGANVDIRFGDTEHGGDQTTEISALFGANVADDRGNVMLGIERSTRTKQYQWERDWRVEDMANPNVAGGGFAFGSATWWHNEPVANNLAGANNPAQTNANISAAALARGGISVDSLFPPTTGSCAYPVPATPPPPPAPQTPVDQANRCRISNNLGATRFRTNRDGTIFTGLADPNSHVPGSVRFNGPVWQDGGSGDLDGDFQGYPVFVRQPNGNIKENVLYQWASSPLERLSAFANGHFDVADNLRVTGQAMVTRTKTESSLGLAAANINQWGVGIPFGDAIYRGNPNTYYDIPDSLVDVNNNGIAEAGIDRTNASYTPTGRYGVNCDAPVGTPGMPWADGLPGCTNSEAFPISEDVYRLMITRARPNELLWASREPDWMRSALGAGRSTNNITTTMSFTLGLEGELPSGDHSWDVSLYTGRSDNTVNQLGSMRLTSYRDVASSPNFGRNATFDSNPWEAGGFAESIPTCTSGLPIADDRPVSQDCLQMISPALKNVREMTQTILEGNLVGDLAEMRAGPLQYALGMTYRENGFDFVPDNLSDVQNLADPIAGLFPNESSAGEFDVSEIYGELLVPIVSDGPKGVEHFNLELGARISDWSMEQMPNLETYKALLDWAVSPRYRIRGGFNRAFRAPNLGELFIRRTQLFGGGGSRDWCSQNLDAPGAFSATPAAGKTTAPTAQSVRSQQICAQLMGPQGATFYYDPTQQQPLVGGTGIPNTFGNPNLREEQADTWTIGVAMDIIEDWRLTVDWYQIEIENMIALEGADTTYQLCLDMAFNPNGDLNNESCQRIFRNPTTGGGALVDRTFTNEGRALFSGVDVALNWSRQLEAGGGLNFSLSANAPVHEVTQDRSTVQPQENAGYNICALQLQCQNYDYRMFTSIGYSRGSWGMNMRHQYWPELQNNACRTNATSNACINSTLPAHGLFDVSANFRFADRYSVVFGIENLLDEEPPCIGANPTAFPFPTDCSRTGDGATYDPLGRRFNISMSMEF